jgi:hypothetical protein
MLLQVVIELAARITRELRNSGKQPVARIIPARLGLVNGSFVYTRVTEFQKQFTGITVLTYSIHAVTCLSEELDEYSIQVNQ